MIRTIQNLLFSPRAWAISAMLCFAGCILIGYHQDQMAAKLVLDQMVGKDTNAADVALTYEAQRQVLFVISFTMLMVAIMLKYRQSTRAAQPTATKPQSSASSKRALSGAFQPIRTQEEIIGEDEVTNGDHSRRRRVSRVASQIAQSTFQVVRLVKSRQ